MCGRVVSARGVGGASAARGGKRKHAPTATATACTRRCARSSSSQRSSTPSARRQQQPAARLESGKEAHRDVDLLALTHLDAQLGQLCVGAQRGRVLVSSLGNTRAARDAARARSSQRQSAHRGPTPFLACAPAFCGPAQSLQRLYWSTAQCCCLGAPPHARPTLLKEVRAASIARCCLRLRACAWRRRVFFAQCCAVCTDRLELLL